MSVIDKYPFINAVLTSLSDEDLASLQECVNGQGAPNVFKSILAGSPYLLKTTDKGVYPVDLEVAKFGTAQTVYPGFLIFNDDYCVLISFATERSQILTVLDLHLVNGLWKSEIKPFELSITDLRSELFDFMGGEGGGGSGGGTVEAEPIVSIKMTNLEINGGTPTGVDTGYGLQLYCTKERWNNMVAMAKQIDSSLDITYANFGTIFSQLSSQQRIMLIAFLYYDYIDGKVLPLSTLSYDYDDGNGDQGTIALETKYYLYFEENGQKLAAPAFENPSNNNIVVQIITPRTDTVITVEEIEGASIGASGSDTTASPYDYVQMCFNNSNNNHIILMFDREMVRTDNIKAGVNQLITTLNTMGSLSIPAYNDLEDLETIADYLNALDTNTYGQIKVVFWASMFSVYPYLCLSLKGYGNGMAVPTIIEGIADQDNNNFAYTVKMMDSTGQMNTVASEQTIFDFDVFVNDLD